MIFLSAEQGKEIFRAVPWINGQETLLVETECKTTLCFTKIRFIQPLKSSTGW